MASLLLSSQAKRTNAPLASVFKRMVHNNPGFQKYTSRAGGRLPDAGLAEAHPGTPESQPHASTPVQAHATVLNNGVRVASISSNSPVAALGVYITSGSRHESRDEAGSTHFLKHLAFKSTKTRTGIEVVRDIESLGATFSATAGREHLLFESQVLPDKAPELLAMLGDMLQPRVAYHEVERQKPHVEEDAEHLSADPLTSLMELLHREAFRNRGLGQPLVAPHYNIGHLTFDGLAKFVNARFTPNNIVVVASGVEHTKLVETVHQTFPSLPPQYETDSSNTKINTAQSKYVGGGASIPSGGDTHIALAFEGISNKDQKDTAALQVLQQLLGGGAHSSKDGPGVGLQSRLNAKIVSPHSHVHNALAFNLSYSDSGLFGVYLQVSSNVAATVNALVAEISSIVKSADKAEVDRAKQLAKSELLHGNSLDTLRFIGAQATSGSSKILTPAQHAAAIDSVTGDDVARVARRVFGTKPTLCAIGDVADLPEVESISASLTK